ELITLRRQRDGVLGEMRLRTAVIDISQRLEAEAALEKSKRNYQLLIDAIDAIVWEADAASHQLSFVSGSAERCLGYPLSEWYRPDFWASHIYVEDRDRILNLLSRAIADRKDTVLEYRTFTAERRVVWMR